jgi:hypothetical protein
MQIVKFGVLFHIVGVDGTGEEGVVLIYKGKEICAAHRILHYSYKTRGAVD